MMDIQYNKRSEETPTGESPAVEPLDHLIDQPIDVPRVRDTEAGTERPLQSYQAMKKAALSQELAEAILWGLSQRDIEGTPSQRGAGQFIDGFGLSQSSVSRRFQERAEKALKEFEHRSLEGADFLALWTDGKHVAGE